MLISITDFAVSAGFCQHCCKIGAQRSRAARAKEGKHCHFHRSTVFFFSAYLKIVNGHKMRQFLRESLTKTSAGSDVYLKLRSFEDSLFVPFFLSTVMKLNKSI